MSYFNEMVEKLNELAKSTDVMCKTYATYSMQAKNVIAYGDDMNSKVDINKATFGSFKCTA